MLKFLTSLKHHSSEVKEWFSYILKTEASKINMGDVNCEGIATKIGVPEINTFIFLDTETTGLGYANITELSMIAYRRKDLITATKECSFPRVMTKILLHLNPQKNIDKKAIEITGLNNHLLDDLKTFDCNTAILINSFLNQFNKRVCIVAHNGYRFDFPILKRHLSNINASLDNEIVCVDSIRIFKSVDQGHKQYGLNEIYKRFFGAYPEQSHYAENDVLNLIKCCVAVKEGFLNYTADEENLMNFNDVKA